MSRVPELARAARRAAGPLARLDAEARSALLLALADALEDPTRRGALFEANAADMKDAEAAQARGELAAALVKRLALSEGKLDSLADGLRTGDLARPGEATVGTAEVGKAVLAAVERRFG